MNAVLFALYLIVPGWALMWAVWAHRAERRAPAGGRWPSAAASRLEEEPRPVEQVRAFVSSPEARPRVLHWLRRLGIPRSHLDDLAQDVLVAAVSSAEKFNPTIGPVSRWLNGVTVNLASHFRQRAWVRREELTGGAVEFPGTVPSPESLVAAEEERGLVREALAHLPVKHAVMVREVDLEERPIAEVAEEQGVPLSTAYKHRAWGLAELGDLVRRMAKAR